MTSSGNPSSCGMEYFDNYSGRLSAGHGFLGTCLLIYIMAAVIMTPHKTLKIIMKTLVFLLCSLLIVYTSINVLWQKLIGQSNARQQQNISLMLKRDVMSEGRNIPKPRLPTASAAVPQKIIPHESSVPQSEPLPSRAPVSWRVWLARINEMVLTFTVCAIIVFILDDNLNHCRILAALTGSGR